MAQDNLKRGQFWRDLTNRDVLQILDISVHTPEVTAVKLMVDRENCVECGKSIKDHQADGRCDSICTHGIEDPWTCKKCLRYKNEKQVLVKSQGEPIWYAKCACYPRGEYYMGIQEMRGSHFETPRFERIGWWNAWRLRRKLSRLSSPPAPAAS